MRLDVASRAFLDFAAGWGRPGKERTVAVLGADRARLLGLAGRAGGGVYLQSYRRVERRKFRKLKREGLDTGGP